MENRVFLTKNYQLNNTGYTRIIPMAEYLGIPHKTLRKWIADEKIPAPKLINGIQLFSNAEIQDWLSNICVNELSDQIEGE